MEAHDSHLRLLATFELGEAGFALDATEVLEVIRAGEITPVAHAHPVVLGVMNLRGRIVTLLDLGYLLGLAPHVWRDRDPVVLVEHGGEWLGLVIDTIGEVKAIADTALLPVPEHLPAELRPHCAAVLRSANRAWLLLRTENLLAEELVFSAAERTSS